MPGAFETGLMWAVYNDLEKGFLSFLEYVPLEPDHSNVHSHKLLQLMLQIGGYIDTAFKEMATYTGFGGNEKCEIIREKTAKRGTVKISLAREAFEPIYHLSSRIVNVKSPRYLARVIVERFGPFSEFKNGKSPKWWRAYNDVKHDWLKNLKKANLVNTLSALAGAFLLNVVHEPSILTLAQWGVVNTFTAGWQPARFNPELLAKMLKREHPLDDNKITVETPLFLWMFRP